MVKKKVVKKVSLKKKKVRKISQEKLFKAELRKHEFRVTVFGSARIKPTSKIYKDIMKLGEKVGEKGYDLVTGGGSGLMEAASIGHRKGCKAGKNGSQVIGLNIHLPHEQKLNSAVDISKEFKKFSNRLDHFMLFSNIVVVAPGGVGTLLELFYAWQLMQVHHICHLPIILLGDVWTDLLKWLKKGPLKKGYFGIDDYNLLFHAKNVDEVMQIVEHAHIAFKGGNKDFCLNVKRYRV